MSAQVLLGSNRLFSSLVRRLSLLVVTQTCGFGRWQSIKYHPPRRAGHAPPHFTRCHVGRDSFGCGLEEPPQLVPAGDLRGEQRGASPCYRYRLDGRRFQPEHPEAKSCCHGTAQFGTPHSQRQAFPGRFERRPPQVPPSPQLTQRSTPLTCPQPPPRPGLSPRTQKSGGALCTPPPREAERQFPTPEITVKRHLEARGDGKRWVLGCGAEGTQPWGGRGGSPRRRSHRQDPGWLLQHKQPPPVPEQARVPCFAGEHPLPAIPPLPRCRALPRLLTSSPAPPRNMPFFMFGIRSRRFFFSPPSDTSVTAQALQESLPCRQFLRPKKSH